MNELNQNLAENLGYFLSEFREDVVKGLQDYLRTNANLSFQTA